MILAALLRPVGKRKTQTGRKPRLPPGPSGYPIIGNLLMAQSFRKDPFYKNLRDMSKFGEMTTLHIGSKTIVLLNSHRVVHELIVKRGSATNERTPMPISSRVLSRDRRSLLLPQEQWAERRRVAHPLLASGSSLKQYGDWQELESTQMMAEYVIKPALWYKHHYRYANSVIHRIVLGERLNKSTKDLDDLQNVVTLFTGSISTSIVDWYPVLDRLPRILQPWLPYWERLGQWSYDVSRKWWVQAREKVDQGIAPPSFIRDSLLHPDSKFTSDDDDCMYVAMQIIEAGSDTTRGALNIMIMAALEHPDVFQRARAEVDRVCGVGKNARLPTLADMDDLGYICAMAKEVLRWRSIFAFPPDHAASRDIEFDGYLFPAGVGFWINCIALAEECENPQAFKPERWLNGHENDIIHGLWAFGGGRRVCIGYRLAQRSLFVNIARLVQSVDYKANGPYNPELLNLEATGEPFPVAVSLRSKDYEDLIIREAETAGVLEDAKVLRDYL
ncbi:cytochrome P450 [Ilyonectria destructans]|nr:cytochrome P450 [Ilyonectria destructans]